VNSSRLWLGLAVPLLLAGDSPGAPPTAFRFEGNSSQELHRLWDASSTAKVEQVACLAATIEEDAVRISRVLPLTDGAADSLGVSAAASLEGCGPPEWRGTVHTHVALRDGRSPYSLFSGADRSIMMMWWQRWRVDGIFCLLYSGVDVICELEGPSGAVLFPRSKY
jgi:hypothetical protein